MSLSNGLRNEHLQEEEAAKLQTSVDAMKQRTGSEKARELGIAALLLENNQNLSAFAVLQHPIDSEQDLVSAYYYLGEVFENANQFDEAQKNYKIAARLASGVLCAAKAGLARVETEHDQKQTRLLSAKAAFEALQKITNDDFVPVPGGEQKGDIVDLLSQLLPGADNGKKKQLILLMCTENPVDIQCGNCAPNKRLGAGGCTILCKEG
ncbi:MAG: hypothetical protein MUC48_01845 [Leptolyngbya sp. Prado105]|jgi:tetratricopeptide (TPR) repeat protein|nr:hypothetical protein [Leptolyngbya sp. Prado105]